MCGNSRLDKRQHIQHGCLTKVDAAYPPCDNPFVMGRKAWLFATSVDGAKASANLYSLVETAKANGHEPHSYFQHALTKLPAAQSLQDIEALLPFNLKPEQCQTV